MRRFGLPQREPGSNQAEQLNWRRGSLRIWILLSAAWIMGWIVYLLLYGIQSGFNSSSDLFAIPILLIGPPIALYAVGILAGWAIRGFKP